MAEPWDSETYHRGMVGQLEHDCAIRHTRRFPQWLLHLRQPDAIERAEPEPLVQHIFEHLGIAPPDALRASKLRSPTLRQYSRPQYDVTVIRNFRIREGHEFQFKAVFGAPNTSPSSSLFEVVPVNWDSGRFQRDMPTDHTCQLNTAPAVEAAFRFPLKFSDSILLALVTTRESANRYGFICSSATMKLLARSARTVGRQIRFGSKLFLKEHFDESIPVLPTFPAARGASYQ